MASYGVHDEHLCLESPLAFGDEVLCWKCLFIVRTLPGEHGGMGREQPVKKSEPMTANPSSPDVCNPGKVFRSIVPKKSIAALWARIAPLFAKSFFPHGRTGPERLPVVGPRWNCSRMLCLRRSR